MDSAVSDCRRRLSECSRQAECRYHAGRQRRLRRYRRQAKSNRESLLTFIGEEIAAIRWRQYRLYPKEFVITTGNPALYGLTGRRAEGNGFPAVFNIEADPREEVNILGTSAWVIGPYLKLIGEYQQSLEQYPNPKAVNLTVFAR